MYVWSSKVWSKLFLTIDIKWLTSLGWDTDIYTIHRQFDADVEGSIILNKLGLQFWLRYYRCYYSNYSVL